jgi:hypothetical protein
MVTLRYHTGLLLLTLLSIVSLNCVLFAQTQEPAFRKPKQTPGPTSGAEKHNKGTPKTTGIFVDIPGLQATGQGIPGVDVGLKKKPPGIIILSLKTDHAGQFNFGILPKGKYALVFSDLPEIRKSKNYNSAKSNTCIIEVSGVAEEGLSTFVSKGGIKGIDIIVKKQPSGTLQKLTAPERDNQSAPDNEAGQVEIEFDLTGKQELKGRLMIVSSENKKASSSAQH